MSKILAELEKHFDLPFPPHDYQEEAIIEMAKRDCSLLKFKVGLGKTVTAAMTALYYSLEDDVEQILILCPPILLDQWQDFLQSIGGIPSILLYRGSPAARKKMPMEDYAVVLASYNIFRGKTDHSRFVKMAKNGKLCIIADELSLKSLSSQTYRKLKQIMYQKMRLKAEDKPYHKLIALNATPISDLGQIYNWCAIMDPGLYGSKKLFDYAHVAKEDQWGNVLEWRLEDKLEKNFSSISIDTDKEVELPDLVETVVPYTLSNAHMKLYKEVKKAELDNLPEDKIELAMRAMFSVLQRLVLIPRDFGLDIESPVLDYINGYLDQLGPDDGVLIYTRHVSVSEMLAEKIPDSCAIYGGVSQGLRDKAFNDLKSGRKRRMVGNLDSLSVGLNLQMLNHTLMVELPFRDDKLTQALGRTHRQGQSSTCFANYPMAKGTIQEKIFHKLLKNQEDLSTVLKTKSDVRNFLD